MANSNNKLQDAKLLIAGGFADFLAYLVSSPNPIIVGGGYPPNKIYDAIREGSKEMDFDLTDINPQLWREACRHGFFKGG
jgi:hypothetical protein